MLTPHKKVHVGNKYSINFNFSIKFNSYKLHLNSNELNE